MFKKLKKGILFCLMLSFLLGAIYVPISQHLVRYKSSYHLVSKDHYGYDQTFIDLDKEPLKWGTILQSQNLRNYFTGHYQNQMMEQFKKRGLSFWEKIRSDALQAVAKVKDSMEKKVNANAIEGLAKRLKKELQALHEKGKNMLKKKDESQPK